MARTMVKAHYVNSRVRNTGLNTYPKRKHMQWGVPFPLPQMGWEELRRLKMRCALECAEFNDIEGACRFALLPAEGCARFRSGGFSGVVEEDTE